MGIEEWSEDIILVDLPQEPEMGEKLIDLADLLKSRDGSNVIIDFSNVDIITNVSINKLLELRELISDNKRKLIICSVLATTMGIFTVTGIASVFEFADDKSAARESLQIIG